MAAPTADWDVETATPPDTATQTSESVAVRLTAPPAWTTLSVTLDSTVLMNRLKAVDPARANFSAPPPATVTVTTTAPSSASLVKEPEVIRVDFSVLARTVLATLFPAMDHAAAEGLAHRRWRRRGLKMPVKSLALRR